MSFNAGDWGQGRLLTGLAPISTESGFVLKITDDNFPSSAFDTGATSCLNGGGDWRFSTDIDGVNQIPCEIVSCITNAIPANVKFEAWVRIPSYSVTATDVYAFWNRSGQLQPGSGTTFGRDAVWQDSNNSFHGNSLIDSTGNSSNLTAINTPQIANDRFLFADGDGYSTSSSGGSFTATDTLCSQYWINRSTRNPDATTPAKELLSYWIDPVGVDGLNVSIDSRNVADGSVYVFTAGGNVGSTVGFGLDINTDYLIHTIWNQTAGTIDVYVNGSLYYAVSSYTDTSVGGDRIFLGVRNDNTGGLIGEMWDAVFTVADKSANRVSLEHQNQSNPGTFWTEGAVFVPSSGAIDVIGFPSSEAFGSLDILVGIPDIQVSSLLSSEVFGSADIEFASLEIDVSSIVSSETFGAVNVELAGAPIEVTVNGFASSQAFGSTTVEVGAAPLEIDISGIVSSEAFGTADIVTPVTLTMTGFTSSESFGSIAFEGDIFSTIPPQPTITVFSPEVRFRRIDAGALINQLVGTEQPYPTYYVGSTVKFERPEVPGQSYRWAYGLDDDD